MQLKATDLDLEVTETVPADIGQKGATTLPAHTLYEIVRKLPDGAQVSLETGDDNGQLQLRSGRSRFNLQSLPEGDFPDLAAGELTHAFNPVCPPPMLAAPNVASATGSRQNQGGHNPANAKRAM